METPCVGGTVFHLATVRTRIICALRGPAITLEMSRAQEAELRELELFSDKHRLVHSCRHQLDCICGPAQGRPGYGHVAKIAPVKSQMKAPA